MFVSVPDRQPRGDGPAPGRTSLALLAERVRPVASSQTRLLPLPPSLRCLFPDAGLRRGSTILVTGVSGGGTDGSAGGAVSLAMAVLSSASEAGAWCAFVGFAGLGAVAARDIGIELDRLAVIPRPGPAWAEATATVIDGVDLVVVRPPFAPRPAMARRLVARARDRRSVLVVVPGPPGWPEPPDLHLQVSDARWDGIGAGEGYLERREVTVTATGRRSAVRPRQCRLWLPSSAGTVAGTDGPAAG